MKRSSVLKRYLQSSLRTLDARKTMIHDERVREALFLQSLEGQVHARHGPYKEPLVEGLNFDEISSILNRNPKDVRLFRGGLVNDVQRVIEDLLEKRKTRLEVTGDMPLYGVDFLGSVEITNARSALQGMVLAGHMDASSWRRQTVAAYEQTSLVGTKFTIGYGDEFLIDPEVLKKKGLSTWSLVRDEHTDEEILSFMESGLIMTKERQGRGFNQYIRRKKGPGICDDAALCTIGRIYGLEAMMLAFVSDATDTYSKITSKKTLQSIPQMNAAYIQEAWKARYHETLIEPEAIEQIIYLGAKSNSPALPFSSSHRRLCLCEDNLPDATFMNHMRFVAGQEYHTQFKLGFNRFKAERFYTSLQRRWQRYDELYGTSLARGKDRHDEYLGPSESHSAKTVLLLGSESDAHLSHS